MPTLTSENTAIMQIKANPKSIPAICIYRKYFIDAYFGGRILIKENSEIAIGIQLEVAKTQKTSLLKLFFKTILNNCTKNPITKNIIVDTMYKILFIKHTHFTRTS